MRRALLLASLSVLLASPVHAAALVNGSFEPADAAPGAAVEPDPGPVPGWLVSGGIRCLVAEDDGFAAPNGSRVIRFGGGADRGTCLWQSFATVPGRPYDVLFWLGSRAEARDRGRAALRVSLTGSIRTVVIDNPSPELLWQAHLVSFVAVDPVTTLAFSPLPGRGAAAAYLDLVTVRPAGVAMREPRPGR